jgi:putative hemolysin
VMTRFGRVPAPADHFDFQGLRFEVVDMDGRRVDKVLVSAATRSEPTAAS